MYFRHKVQKASFVGKANFVVLARFVAVASFLPDTRFFSRFAVYVCLIAKGRFGKVVTFVE